MEVVGNKPLIIRHWKSNTNLLEVALDFVPQWIELHKLSRDMWEEEVVGRICNVLGEMTSMKLKEVRG